MFSKLFSEQQGIKFIPLYTELLEHEKAIMQSNLTFYDPNAFPVIVGNDSWDFLLITIQSGRVIDKKILSPTTDEWKFKQLWKIDQLEKFCNSISLRLKEEVELIKMVNVLRAKWRIPLVNQRVFYFELSTNSCNLFLPDVIIHNDLKKDIGDLCERLDLRASVNEEFYMVAAYLLFGEALDHSELTYNSFDEPSLFKVITNRGYKLYLEIEPNLQSRRWNELYKLVRNIQKIKGFISGDGSIGRFIDMIDSVPEEYTQCHVISIPSAVWRTKFSEVRSYLDERYGVNRFTREEEPTKRTEYVAHMLCKAYEGKKVINKELFTQIAILATEKFPQLITEEEAYSEEAVEKIWRRMHYRSYPIKMELFEK